jgi:hypothetical protein
LHRLYHFGIQWSGGVVVEVYFHVINVVLYCCYQFRLQK